MNKNSPNHHGKLNVFNDVPDRRWEIEKLTRDGLINLRKQQEEERKARENAKMSRILLSKEDKYDHALKLIIEHSEATEISNTSDINISIPFYDFNFEDHKSTWNLLKAFLEKLKKAECFKDFAIGRDISITQVNLGRLKKYTFNRKDDISSYFGFEEHVFRLKRINNSYAVINFYPHKNQESNTYHFMSFLVEQLETSHELDNNCIASIVIKQTIAIEYLKEKLPSSKITLDWLRSTKANLLRKIPNEYKSLIMISDYNSSIEGYKFSLRLPL